MKQAASKKTHDATQSILALLSAFVTCFLLAPSVIAQEADAITSFGVWSIFKDDVACWAASSAEEVNTGSGVPSEESVTIYVSFFRKQPVPEISFLFGEGRGDTMIANVGGVQADFFSDEDGTYFAAERERDLLFAFLKSRQLALSPPSASQPTVTFSLEGFKDAYNHLAKICEFKHADFTDGVVA